MNRQGILAEKWKLLKNGNSGTEMHNKCAFKCPLGGPHNGLKGKEETEQR